MIRKIRHITRYLLVAATLLFTGCSEEAFDSATEDGTSVAVTFRTSIYTEIPTRAISDGVGVDCLLVAVYEGEPPVETYSKVYNLNTALTSGIELRLLKGHSYKVLFWAYDESSTAYTLSDNGVITINYNDYLAGGFAGMEELDAFYAVSEISVSATKSESVTLTRPFAQLNIADNLTRPETGTHRSEVCLEGVATSFNALSGNTIGETQTLTFSFTDFPEETLVSGDDTYYYISTNYLFVPTSGKVTATCRLKQVGRGDVINDRTISEVPLAVNKRTNVFGSFVQEPEDIWDGITLTQPATDEQNRYVIDETSDLAWLATNGSTLEANRTFIVAKDLNMNDNTLSAVTLPQGSTIEGGGHTIKNLLIDGGGLFGNATNLTVKELAVEGITTQNAVTHVGALVNTLYGNGTFSSVTIKNATVATSNGAAGGIVGYVVRTSVTDRSETLAVTFDGCKVESTSISGSESEGKFVGLLSGYDFNETITFAADCSVSDVTIADFTSPYTEGNEGTWLADNDYTTYSGWLGDETYNRGIVNYGSNRFIPRWDGEKKVTPLTDSDGTKLIYSAFDLASLQGSSHSAVTFKENVDLAGVRSTDPWDDTKGTNRFTPISSITNLDGGGYTLYGLYIHVVRCTYWVGGGFMLGISGATTHKNLTFDGASIIVTHDDTQTDDGSARAGTLLPTVEGSSYTAENIHARNGYVYGVNKMGGLFGYIAVSTFKVSNCSVNNYSIVNYNSGIKDSLGFLDNGEIGGMFGFISANSTISNCSVTNSTFNCIGVNNGTIIKVAGRHVNGFIGDIRTTSGQTITITGCNTSNNTFTNRAEDQYKYQSGGNYFKPTYTTLPLIGCCYYINILGVSGFNDTQGKLYIDGTEYIVSKNCDAN